MLAQTKKNLKDCKKVAPQGTSEGRFRSCPKMTEISHTVFITDIFFNVG